MMAVYLARSCSKCGNYFGIVIAEPRPWKIPTDQWSLLRMRIRDSLDADWKMSRYEGYLFYGVAAQHRNIGGTRGALFLIGTRTRQQKVNESNPPLERSRPRGRPKKTESNCTKSGLINRLDDLMLFERADERS